MIERLVETLRILAAPADTQLREFRDRVVGDDALAYDFADAHLLVQSCQQIQLPASQEDALEDVSAALEVMLGAQAAHCWTEEAVRKSEQWERVREAAARALPPGHTFQEDRFSHE